MHRQSLPVRAHCWHGGQNGPVTTTREGDWAAPEERPAAPGGATGVAVDPPGPAGTIGPGAAAGVAAARGDVPWPASADATDLGDRNPLGAVEPVGVGGVLDGGFDLLRVGFGPLVGMAAALLLPLQLVELLLRLQQGLDTGGSTSANSFFGGVSGALDGRSTALTWVLVLLRVMVLSFLGLAAGIMARELLAGRLPTGRALWAAAGRRWWVAALIPLLTVPVKSLGACLLYVGFFLLDALLMCASVAAGAEGLGPLAAFRRSWRLGGASYGSALGISVGSFAISTILKVALYLGPVVLVAAFSPSVGVVVAVQQAASLTLLIAQPLTACIAARAYVQFRCSSEGLDLERRRVAQGLVGPATTAASVAAAPAGVL